MRFAASSASCGTRSYQLSTHDYELARCYQLSTHYYERGTSYLRDARLLVLAQQVHILTDVEPIRPRSPAQPRCATAARAARKRVPAHVLLAVPLAMARPTRLDVRRPMVLALGPARHLRVLVEVVAHVAVRLALPHRRSERRQPVRMQHVRNRRRRRLVLGVKVEDVTQCAREAIRREGLQPARHQHQLAHRVWVRERPLLVHQPQLPKEREERHQLGLAQLGRHAA